VFVGGADSRPPSRSSSPAAELGPISAGDALTKYRSRRPLGVGEKAKQGRKSPTKPLALYHI